MLKYTKPGMIVWGAILTLAGLGLVVGMASSYYYVNMGLIIGIVLLVGGLLLLVFGIVNAVKVNRYNSMIISQGRMYTGRCTSCGSVVRTDIRPFRPHGNYPEGYMICPTCKKPVSKNAFTEFDSNGNVLSYGTQQIVNATGYSGQQNVYPEFEQYQQNQYQQAQYQQAQYQQAQYQQDQYQQAQYQQNQNQYPNQ